MQKLYRRVARLQGFLIAFLGIVFSNANGAEIDQIFKCVVESNTSISIATNLTDAVEVKKEPANRPITVIYAKDNATGFVIEKWDYGSTNVATTVYSKGYAAGGTTIHFKRWKKRNHVLRR